MWQLLKQHMKWMCLGKKIVYNKNNLILEHILKKVKISEEKISKYQQTLFNLIRIFVLNFRFNFTITLNRKLHKNNNVLRIFLCEFRTDTWTFLWIRFTFKQKERHDLVNNTYYISIHTSTFTTEAFVKGKTLRRDHSHTFYTNPAIPLR